MVKGKKFIYITIKLFPKKINDKKQVVMYLFCNSLLAKDRNMSIRFVK